jgi:gluconokinase
MVSGSGLWHQTANVYDDEMLAFLPIQKSQLAPETELDQFNNKLLPEYAAKWPMLDRIPWYPALGDGACNNLGSGCATPDRFALMVGTTGAMRVVLPNQQLIPPEGLWSYRADRTRQVFGGAISNGGEVFRWMSQTLRLDEGAALEAELGKILPGAHGLTVLPFFAGERAPYWRADLRATIFGMGLSTKPVDILRASLESVALRFSQIYRMMTAHAPEPKEVMASGGALLKSEVWTQMMADALGRPVIACAEPEASSRGAALWVLERLGIIPSIETAPVRTSGVIAPRAEYTEIYDRLLLAQTDLFNRLYS